VIADLSNTKARLCFELISRLVFVDRSLSGLEAGNRARNLAKLSPPRRNGWFPILVASERWLVFGESVIVGGLAVPELKIRVSVVRFRDWPPADSST